MVLLFKNLSMTQMVEAKEVEVIIVVFIQAQVKELEDLVSDVLHQWHQQLIMTVQFFSGTGPRVVQDCYR